MQRIELTPDEQEFYERISNDPEKDDLPFAGLLYEKLREREAIPIERLKYFYTDEYNIGARGKSRYDVFERNNTRGKEIYVHPHFIKYLEYFINGPDLPQNLKREIDYIFSTTTYHDDALEEVFSHLKSRKLIPKDLSERERFSEEIFKAANEMTNGESFAYCELIRERIIKQR